MKIWLWIVNMQDSIEIQETQQKYWQEKDPAYVISQEVCERQLTLHMPFKTTKFDQNLS